MLFAKLSEERLSRQIKQQKTSIQYSLHTLWNKIKTLIVWLHLFINNN
jgi:hypothetical protein